MEKMITMQFRVNARQVDALKILMPFAKEEPNASPWTRAFADRNPEGKKDFNAAVLAALDVGLQRKDNLIHQTSVQGHDIIRVKVPESVKRNLDSAADGSPLTRSEFRSRLLCIGIPSINEDPYVNYVNRSVQCSSVLNLTPQEWGMVEQYRSRSTAMKKALQWFTDKYTTTCRGFRTVRLATALHDEMLEKHDQLVDYCGSNRGRYGVISKRVYWPKPLLDEEDFAPFELPEGWTFSEVCQFAMTLWVEAGMKGAL